MKPWWIAFPDGRKFNLDGDELIKGVESGIYPEWLQGSFQGGPYVPISQAPAVRAALGRRNAALAEAHRQDTNRKLKVLGIFGGSCVAVVLILALIGGVIDKLDGGKRAKEEQARQEQAKKEEEAERTRAEQDREKAEKEFKAMSPGEKLKNAEKLVSANNVHEARRYLEAIPKTSPVYGQAVRLESKIKQQEKEAAEEKMAEELLGPRPVNSAWDGSVLCCKQYLRNALNDPGSAEYSNWTQPVIVQYKKVKMWRVQCVVRAKNGFGAYIAKDVSFYIMKNQVIACDGL